LKPRTLTAVALLAFVLVAFLIATFHDTTPLGRFALVLCAAGYLFALHYIALWFLVSRRFGAQRAQAVVVNVSLLIITVAVFSIGSEFLLRFLFRDVTTTGDNNSYFSKQWLKTVHLNRFGFRERDFDLAKPPGTYRIAVIGDSLAYGQGIPEDNRFSNIIEDRLNRTGKGKYEVLNFALPGAETVDELGFLSRAALPARPDFVLLQWYINDVQGADDKSQAPHVATLVPSALRWNSALFYLLHRQVSSLQSRIGLVESGDAFTLARFKDPSSPSSVAAAESMSAFIETCARFNVPLGLVLFSESYFDPNSRLDFLLERMRELCQQRGLRCVDTRPILLPHQGDTRLWASRLDPHPSALAHQLVADRLLATFGNRWLAR
jgi:lysophospholipase L1-like esterase